MIGKLHQHAKLAVRCKTRQNSGCVVIIKEFSAKFQVEFSAELGDALCDFFRLHFQISIVVKPDFEHGLLLFLLRPL